MEIPAFRQSSLLTAAGFRHAFFTRNGGVSTGAYGTLNFSSSVGDSPDNVAMNLARAATALGVNPSRVYFLSQVHGRQTLVLDGSEDRQTTLFREGDALASNAAGVACGVRAADCVPILLAHPDSGAVAAAHAGWRGVVAGVIFSALESLATIAGDSGNILAAIGPHISVAAFEVSDEVAQTLLESSPDPDVISRQYGDKPHVDLRRIVRAQLQAAGVRNESIDDVVGCTFGDSEHFFSYRRDGKRSGRHLAAIVPAR